jgi:acetylornithine deacetylase/succinyl-diaminopimelate desuccinylase-like protein
VIFIEVPGTARDDTVLLYGHLDKQPEMTGWAEGLGPWTPGAARRAAVRPRRRRRRLRRFASLTAILAAKSRASPRALLVLIEACEESGSFDLPAYIEHLAPRIGTPSLVVCLDSGCGNYDQLWCTTSLRGLVLGTLEVEPADARACTPATARASCRRASASSAPAADRLEDERHRRDPSISELHATSRRSSASSRRSRAAAVLKSTRCSTSSRFSQGRPTDVHADRPS